MSEELQDVCPPARLTQSARQYPPTPETAPTVHGNGAATNQAGSGAGLRTDDFTKLTFEEMLGGWKGEKLARCPSALSYPLS